MSRYRSRRETSWSKPLATLGNVALAFVVTSVLVLACKDGESALTAAPKDSATPYLPRVGPSLPHDAGVRVLDPDSQMPGNVSPEGSWKAYEAEWTTWLPEECPELLISVDPKQGVPPIRWQPCSGNISGCQELVITWEFEPTAFVDTQVTAVGDDVVIGMTVFSRGAADELLQWRFFATAQGTPLASWLWHNRQQPGCGGVATLATSRHFALGLGRTAMAPEKSPGFVALLNPANPGEVRAQLPMNAYANFDLTEQLVSGRDLAARLFVYDIERGVETEVTLPDSDIHMSSLFRDKLLMTRMYHNGEREALDGWVWSPGAAAKPLIEPRDELLFDLEADDSYLVWTLSTGSRALEWSDVEVWRSPLTFQQDEVRGERLASIPNTRASRGYGRAENGYYAVVEGNLALASGETTLHLVRLTDGHHVEVPKPADTQAGMALHIGQDEIWYVARRGGVNASIVRQRLADL